MYLADLVDTDFSFKFNLADDRCDYWEYDFAVEKWDDIYIRNLTLVEIKQLKTNCEKILSAIKAIQGGN